MIKVVKTSSTSQVTKAGQTVVYSFTVSNPGNTTLSAITVSDAKCNAAPVYVAGDSNNDKKLQLSESWVYTCSHTVTQSEVDAGGNLVNTVTVNSDKTPPAKDILNIPVNQNPLLSITKSTEITHALVGQVVSFTITIANIGNVTLNNVVVTDPAATNCSRTIGTLAVGETQSYICSMKVNELKTFTNVAAGTATSPSGESATDEDSAEVVVDVEPFADDETDEPTAGKKFIFLPVVVR